MRDVKDNYIKRGSI